MNKKSWGPQLWSIEDFKYFTQESVQMASHLQFLGLSECFATLQTPEGRTSSARTRCVVTAATTMSILLLLMMMLLLVFLVVLHM
jgi:hypothetical protein